MMKNYPEKKKKRQQMLN